MDWKVHGVKSLNNLKEVLLKVTEIASNIISTLKGHRLFAAKSIMGLIWPPLEPKAESCSSHFFFLIGLLEEYPSVNSGIYLKLTVTMVTKMADKIGSK